MLTDILDSLNNLQDSLKVDASEATAKGYTERLGDILDGDGLSGFAMDLKSFVEEVEACMENLENADDKDDRKEAVNDLSSQLAGLISLIGDHV